MPAGRYTVMDGEGHPVGTEDFRCAPGPMGWRYFAEIHTSDPEPHDEVVDLAVDADRRPARTRIATGSHEILLVREGDRLAGFRDGQALELPFDRQIHLDYLSPAYNAVTTMRLAGSAEIDVVYLDPVTVEPRLERQRYEDLGDDEIDTPVGRFATRRWGFTALGSGWSRHVWVAGDVVARFEGLYELEWYEAGASGPRPLA